MYYAFIIPHFSTTPSQSGRFLCGISYPWDEVRLHIAGQTIELADVFAGNFIVKVEPFPNLLLTVILARY